jgi:SAM-dependent methyltransferase
MTLSERERKRRVTQPEVWTASALVRRFASKIVSAAGHAPILDVACGSGRNAVVFSRLGSTVICIDKDLTVLQNQLSSRKQSLNSSSPLVLHHLDLVKDIWPFGPGTAGAIINVHFLLMALLPCFERSLKPGGYLLLESVPGCGGNYIQLPAAGQVKNTLSEAFEFDFYKEKKVGPPACDAVTVKAVARRL